MSKWEIQVDQCSMGGYISIVAARGERTKQLFNIYGVNDTRPMEDAAQEALDSIIQLNAAEVTPLAALEVRFWAAVERIKQPDADLAEPVVKGIRQDLDLLRGAMNDARIDECQLLEQRRYIQRYSWPAEGKAKRIDDVIPDRIRELEAEGEEA